MGVERGASSQSAQRQPLGTGHSAEPTPVKARTKASAPEL